jgi:hypothetical protein
MMKLVRRRQATSTELRLEQLRRARVDAPTLRQFLPDASQVWVELAFDADARLAQAARVFTIFPTAQAHFVYACPFGDCDGTYDLNESVFALLRAHAHQSSGVLQCIGRRARRAAPGPQCGLGMAYAVAVSYDAQLRAS